MQAYQKALAADQQAERDELQTWIYEGHKLAFGVKGRHYDFEKMTLHQLREEAAYIQREVKRTEHEDMLNAARRLAEFENSIQICITHGAPDRETALRWLTDGLTFHGPQCVEQYVWDKGILFTAFGRKLVDDLSQIVVWEQ